MSMVTPQRRRRQACERCWKRKQKCDKLYPVCTACAELHIECRERRFSIGASGTEEVGIAHGSVVSYIESLKARVSRLERGAEVGVVACNKRRRTSSIAANSRIATSPEGLGTWGTQHVPSTPASQGGVAGAEIIPPSPLGVEGEPSVQGTMGGIGLLSRSAMAEPPNEQESERLPRNLTFENMTMAALALDGPDATKASLSDARKLGLVTAVSHHQTVRLTRSGTSAYLERFLKDVCVLFPFLDAKSLREEYDAIPDDEWAWNHHHIEDNVSGQKAQAYLTVYLAVATGALLAQESSSLTPLINSLHASSVKLFSVVMRKGSGLGVVHCILCLVIFSTYSPHGGSIWHLTGLAMTKCISLGLHKRPEPHVAHSSGITDCRQKLFWSTYLLDRSISTVMGRPFRIQDEDITAQVDNGLSTPRLEDVMWHHLVTHARLTSNILANRGSTPLTDYGNFCFWRNHPSELMAITRTQPTLANHLDQLACRLLVHIASASSTRSEDASSALLTSSRREIEMDTIESCKAFIDRCYDRFNNDCHSGSFIEACDILAAGISFVCLTHRYGRESNHGLADAVEVIQKCSTLVTMIGERFVALKSFQQVLLGISSRLMTRSSEQFDGHFSPPVGTVQRAQSGAYPLALANTERQLELPLLIPNQLRQLLTDTFGML